MRYIIGDPTEEGCIFCNRLASANDANSLILHRADHSFVIMNLFPYNTGHIMIVPNAHIAEIDYLEPNIITEMACLLPPVVRALRRVLGCDGFNIGFNQGSIAGAGVAEHLHQHVVPRWQGDANFMPILSGTMVIPELIPSTYAKLRAELEAEIRHVSRFEVVLMDDADEPSVWLLGGDIPMVRISPDSAVWRTAVQQFALEDAEVVGYSGGSSTLNHTSTPGLVIRTSSAPHGSGWQKQALFPDDHSGSCSGAVRDTLHRVRTSLAPWIDGARGNR